MATAFVKVQPQLSRPARWADTHWINLSMTQPRRATPTVDQAENRFGQPISAAFAAPQRRDVSQGSEEPELCILIPCLNEERTIGGVVDEYREEFPGCRIVVVDNGSVDCTAVHARSAGAEVIVEKRRGKAQAVLAALPLIDEELVLMVDGDETYPAAGARLLMDRYREDPCDMLIGIRCAVADDAPTFRPMHQFGTRAFAQALGMVFAHRTGDIFSGLRLFSKRFHRNVPILSRGFELEMELTIQCIDKGFTMAEVEVPFRERPAGSNSKLNTIRDGLRILTVLLVLFRDYRPLSFFGSLALLLGGLGLVVGSLPVFEYLATGQVQRFPLAILAAGLVNLGFLTSLTGVMLESALRHRREGFQWQLRQFDTRNRPWTWGGPAGR